MVTRRNVVHGAIFLITALLATAGIFLQLRAEFLFIVQIILYVGGIMVLFVFVIMLVNPRRGPPTDPVRAPEVGGARPLPLHWLLRSALCFGLPGNAGPGVAGADAGKCWTVAPQFRNGGAQPVRIVYAAV